MTKAADELAEQFKAPPEETKPWCYWYWLNGGYTAEGITKDLEAMSKVGIKRAMIAYIDGEGGESGSVDMFTEQWYELTLHAFSEANRLSVELAFFNGPGWSQSGGPWISPEQSMRRVTWNEIDAGGGSFIQTVRPADVPPGQDIAVLAVPRNDSDTLVGVNPAGAPLANSRWIWHPGEGGAAANSVPAATRYFRVTFDADPSELGEGFIDVTADNIYTVFVNGTEVGGDSTWENIERYSVLSLLQPGSNTIGISVVNSAESPAGLIANVSLLDRAGDTVAQHSSGASWESALSMEDDWLPAFELGPMGIAPWNLSPSVGGILTFTSAEPFTARGLFVHGRGNTTLYAIEDGQRRAVATINANGGSPQTDFMPNGVETFSFPDVTAQRFEIDPDPEVPIELTSSPTVEQVVEKQMGRVHPTPSPSWESYIFPDSTEPGDPESAIRSGDILNLTEYLDDDGVLACTLPSGDWTVIYFGMVTTGARNGPAPPEGTGLEVDKMNRENVAHHFDSMFNPLLDRMNAAQRSVFKGIVVDSYERGAQNWTDGFEADFSRRNGYDPIQMLPVLTGRILDSAGASDQFLWDLRRAVSDMIAENYVGGLREKANENGLTLWLENYGHWGYPGEFLIYGGYSDEIAGEFWTTGNDLGNLETRSASSAAHIYGKKRVYAEAFTSTFSAEDHPYRIKARGEEMFTEGANHFVLHVYVQQNSEDEPGNTPWFGTAFHRNTPWFAEGRDWVKYLQRCHYMLQQGNPAADVAVYIGDFAPQMTGPADPMPEGYDFDYIGSDAILHNLQIVDGDWVVYDENDSTRISARWKYLALPAGLGHIRPQIQERMDQLIQAGGKILEGVPIAATTLSAAGIKPVVSDTSTTVRWKARELADGMEYFVCNFGATGSFTGTFRVTGKVPELFNPVTGEVVSLAKFESVDGGTRVSFEVKDRADSFFLVFRKDTIQPWVTSVAGPGAPLQLSYNEQDQLVAQTKEAGIYHLAMSDGTSRQLNVTESSQTFSIPGPWSSRQTNGRASSIVMENQFTLPENFGSGQRVNLELGAVTVMAKVTLNGQSFDTLWMPPYSLDVTEAILPGENQLQVLLTSTSGGTAAMGENVILSTSTRRVIDPNTVRLNHLVPSPNATGVDVDRNLVMRFDRDVVPGNGEIILIRSNDEVEVEVFDVNSSNRIEFVGNTLVIDPTHNLSDDQFYHVLVDSGAILDLEGRAFEGISSRSSWSFTTSERFPIQVLEPSFEGARTLGGWVPGSTPGPGNSTASQLDPWIRAGSGFGYGWISPGEFNDPMPDGQVYAYANAGDNIRQTLSETLQANTTYHLEVATGWRLDLATGPYPNFPGYGVELWAGGTLLASEYSSNRGGTGVPPVAGQWKEVTVSYSASDSDPQLGQPLQIRLLGYGVQTNYDHVRLGAQRTDRSMDFQTYVGDSGFGLDSSNQGFLDDPDSDGLPNGIEAWFGSHPNQSNRGFSEVIWNGSNFKFSHPINENIPLDLIGFYEWSPNMNDWFLGGSGPQGDPVVTFSSRIQNGLCEVTATPSEVIERMFIRLVVSMDRSHHARRFHSMPLRSNRPANPISWLEVRESVELPRV